MAFHIQNLVLAGKKAILGVEHVVFDAAGVAKVESEKLYKELLNLPNFTIPKTNISTQEVEKVAQDVEKVADKVQEADVTAEQVTEKITEPKTPAKPKK